MGDRPDFIPTGPGQVGVNAAVNFIGDRRAVNSGSATHVPESPINVDEGEDRAEEDERPEDFEKQRFHFVGDRTAVNFIGDRTTVDKGIIRANCAASQANDSTKKVPMRKPAT